MATQVVMPKLSPTMEEGQLSRWLKKEGDKVSRGEPLAEIDTDKATMEMQALSNGVLRKIQINEGESAPLGQPIAIIGEADEDISQLLNTVQAVKSQKAAAAPARLPESDAAPAVGSHASTDEPQEKKASVTAISEDGSKTKEVSAGGRVLVSPIAARMAADSGISLSTLRGSGPSGRIVKRDVEEAISGKGKQAPPRLHVVAPQTGSKPVAYEPSAYRDEPL